MVVTDILRVDVFEDSGFSIMARIKGQDGANITQASLTSIAIKVFDLSSATPTTAIVDTTRTIATVVFDTLQVDERWTADGRGYNFRDDIAASVLTSGDHTYQFEYLFTPASGEAWFYVVNVTTHRVFTS